MKTNIAFVSKLFDGFKTIRANTPEFIAGEFYDTDDLDEHGNRKDWKTKFYEYLLELRGFNSLPKIMQKSEFDNLEILTKPRTDYAPSPTIYHGFKKSEYGRDYLTQEKYHHSVSKDVSIFGTFFTLRKDEALAYTKDRSGENSENRILACKLLSSNGVRVSELRKNCFNRLFMDDFSEVDDEKQREGMRAFFKILKQGEQTEDRLAFREFFESSNAAMAALLGYDYVIDDKDTGYLICVNRGVLATTPEELSKFSSMEEQSAGER